MLASANGRLAELGLQALPHKNSVGWRYSLKDVLGWKKEKIGNTEERDIDPEEGQQFKQHFNTMVEETNTS